MSKLISRLVALAVVSGGLALGASADWRPRPAGDAEFSFQRLCAPGETRVYDLERRTYQDGSLTYSAAAVSSHTVQSCSPYRETARFLALAKFVDRQPIDLSAAAAQFPGFSISLASGTRDDDDGPASATVPEAEQTLRGLARDLHAVLGWADAAAGSGRLRRAGDEHTRASPRRSRPRAPGPAGRETCSEVRMGLKDLTPTAAAFRVSLTAPDSPCLEPRQPWLEASVGPGGPPNNYRAVACSGRICSVRWGQERTVVDAVLDRRTGALVSAELEGVRLLKERTGCDAALEHCSPESAASSRRRFILKLRPPALASPSP